MSRTATTRFARSVPRHRKPEFATSENSGLDCEKFHERPGRSHRLTSAAKECAKECDGATRSAGAVERLRTHALAGLRARPHASPVRSRRGWAPPPPRGLARGYEPSP